MSAARPPPARAGNPLMVEDCISNGVSNAINAADRRAGDALRTVPDGSPRSHGPRR